MDKKQLYNALESCLSTLKQNTDIDSALAKYPDLGTTLRPLLEASLHAQTYAVSSVPDRAFSQGRVKLFKHLAEMQSDHLCWRTTSPLPSFVHSLKKNWNSVHLPLFINRHTHQALDNPVKEDLVHHNEDNKPSDNNDHMHTPQS